MTWHDTHKLLVTKNGKKDTFFVQFYIQSKYLKQAQLNPLINDFLVFDKPDDINEYIDYIGNQCEFSDSDR